MANLNKVLLIGRLTRDPEFRSFASGGRVASFGFAVTNRRRNPQTGQWEDDPMFIDCSVFNSETNKQADRVEQFGLRKGSQLFLEGRLVLDRWDDKNTGEKRSKHKLVVDNFQILDPRSDGGSGGNRGSNMTRSGVRGAPMGDADVGDDIPLPEGESDIPF
ncbi:MAG: single-stranded DNA-binding protein [Gemmataceae bacterium]|nr:single-stranded DNA-binding protein [Gemmataceae bacterium]